MTVLEAANGGQRCPKHDGALRIATLNVRSLKGKMPEVLQLADSLSVDILCLQEVRLSEDNLLAASHAAKRSGWQFFASPCAMNNAGAPTAGVAILSKWPVDKYVLPDPSCVLRAQQGRWQIMRVHRPGSRPFLCVNLYLHASDKMQARNLGKSLFEAIAVSGEDCIFIGDWNCTAEEEPVCSVLRSGCLHMADDVAGIETLAIPTHDKGRHIDFALHSIGLVPCARSQSAGIADHCAVMYDFAVAGLEPCFKVPPPKTLKAKEPVEQERWDASFPLERFDLLLAQQDVQRAWNLLSDHAESLLQPHSVGRSRTTVPGPTCVATAPTKVERLQTVLERRLRRTLRRLAELQKTDADWSLARKVLNALPYLQKHFPELTEVQNLDTNLIAVLEQCLQKEICASREARLQSWKRKMEEDESSLVRWVKGADKVSCFATDDSRVPVHPQRKAEHFANFWQKVWSPPSLAQEEAVDPFLDWIPPGGFSCSEPNFTPANLRSQVRKAVGKAHGPDGWTGDSWSLLPMGFFDALAKLWNVVMKTARLPYQWHSVRCVLIPKEVGLRPISIAALAWRTGIGVLAQQLAHWIDSWAPDELVGGLKGRSSATAHEQLHESIAWPKVFGAKIDIAKCFDHVDVKQALRVWSKLGAPHTVVAVLQSFYDKQTKTMEWLGSSTKPFGCSRGLLQGCPLSCGLLAGLMTVWYWHIKASAPQVCVSVFIDDRTLWSSDWRQLCLSLEASSRIEEALGLSLNHSKCELFCKCSSFQLVSVKRWNHESHRNWKVCRQFKLLGVHYSLSKRRRTPVEDTVTRKVSARLRRLRTATSNQRNKRKLTRSLVLSLFAHSGPWTTVSKKLLNQWRNTIEQTIIGRAVPGRSRFLLWQYLGPDLCPEFALDRRVVFHELWKVRRAVSSCCSLLDIEQVCAAMPQPSTSYRLAEVLNKWQWQHISQSRFRTPQGDLDLAFDGLPAIKEAMRHAWLAYLWRNEPRAQDDTEVCQRVLPVYQAHSAWMRQGVSDWESFCIAVGAGKDSRKLAKQHELESFNCACGREWPSRTHVTWHCPSCPGLPEASRPTRKAEERLLVPSIQLPPIPDERCSQFLRPDPNLCDLFRRTATADQVLLVASDGSSQKVQNLRRAAWSVATTDRVFAARLQGLDQNIFGAESVAVLKAFIAATHLRVDLLLVCDNLAVVRRVKQIQTTGYLPQWAPGLWKALSLVCSTHEIAWVPSHDKLLDWTPSLAGHMAETWRLLNKRADAKAQEQAARSVHELLDWKFTFDAAVAWSASALDRQRSALRFLRRLIAPSAPSCDVPSVGLSA